VLLVSSLSQINSLHNLKLSFIKIGIKLQAEEVTERRGTLIDYWWESQRERDH
jgi:hypothetical protein